MTNTNNDRETKLDTAAKVLAHAFKDLLETRKDPATDSRRRGCLEKLAAAGLEPITTPSEALTQQQR